MILLHCHQKGPTITGSAREHAFQKIEVSQVQTDTGRWRYRLCKLNALADGERHLQSTPRQPVGSIKWKSAWRGVWSCLCPLLRRLTAFLRSKLFQRGWALARSALPGFQQRRRSAIAQRMPRPSSRDHFDAKARSWIFAGSTKAKLKMHTRTASCELLSAETRLSRTLGEVWP